MGVPAGQVVGELHQPCAVGAAIWQGQQPSMAGGMHGILELYPASLRQPAAACRARTRRGERGRPRPAGPSSGTKRWPGSRSARLATIEASSYELGQRFHKVTTRPTASTSGATGQQLSSAQGSIDLTGFVVSTSSASTLPAAHRLISAVEINRPGRRRSGKSVLAPGIPAVSAAVPSKTDADDSGSEVQAPHVRVHLKQASAEQMLPETPQPVDQHQ